VVLSGNTRGPLFVHRHDGALGISPQHGAGDSRLTGSRHFKLELNTIVLYIRLRWLTEDESVAMKTEGASPLGLSTIHTGHLLQQQQYVPYLHIIS
jgi:hypothetical protein